jgi:hypothetical protein
MNSCMDISSRFWSVNSLEEQSATCAIDATAYGSSNDTRSKRNGPSARTRRGYLDERGGEVPGEEAEVRAAAVAGAGERPVLAGPPGRGEPREDDGAVGRHEAVDELRVGQRRSVHALHLPHHLHAAVHLVDRGRGKGGTLASSAASLGLGRRRSWKCAVAESPELGATSRPGRSFRTSVVAHPPHGPLVGLLVSAAPACGRRFGPTVSPSAFFCFSFFVFFWSLYMR